MIHNEAFYHRKKFFLYYVDIGGICLYKIVANNNRPIQIG
jgi:hypothetical protein